MAKKYLFINPPVQAVSKWQMYNYAEPYPYGMLKLATMLKKQGHSVRLIDMMVYDHLDKAHMAHWPDNAVEYSRKHAGNNRVKDVLRPAYLLGRDMAYLERRLREAERPDEIWVTGCLSFDWETAHDAIAVAKKVFPDVTLRFGGNYPSLVPEQAGKSLADEIVSGCVEEAEWEFGDLSLFDEVPPLGLFNLATGCSNRCTFCVNHRYKPTLRHEPKRLMYYLLKTRKDFGIRHFSNWDPNVMLFKKKLEDFLDLLIDADCGLTFAFNMGIQPDRLDLNILEKMRKAGVTQLTIPYESSDPHILERYRKPYRFETSLDRMKLIREVGFEVGRFHATAVFGYEDEDIRHLFRTYTAMVLFGAQPDFFPLTPTPGSAEFERLRPIFDGKPFDELNGYLFPLLGSRELIELYDLLITICNQHYLDRALAHARQLPAELEKLFHEELQRTSEMLKRMQVELITRSPEN